MARRFKKRKKQVGCGSEGKSRHGSTRRGALRRAPASSTSPCAQHRPSSHMANCFYSNHPRKPSTSSQGFGRKVTAFPGKRAARPVDSPPLTSCSCPRTSLPPSQTTNINMGAEHTASACSSPSTQAGARVTTLMRCTGRRSR